MCVSFTVSVPLTIARRWPNPGMFVPCEFGSATRNLLAPEEHQQAIARPGVVPHVGGPGVLIDAGVGRSDKARRAVGVEIVRARNERHQLANHGICGGGALRVGRHHGVQVDALALPQSLVGGKEERAAAKDRAAERPAELVAIERVRVGRREFEEVARVERLVAEELVGLAAELVRSRARHQVDDRARHVPELGAERRIVDLELLDARHRRRKADRPERQVVGGHAVDDVADGFLAVAGGIERERAGAANRRGRESRLRRRRPIRGRAGRDRRSAGR